MLELRTARAMGELRLREERMKRPRIKFKLDLEWTLYLGRNMISYDNSIRWREVFDPIYRRVYINSHGFFLAQFGPWIVARRRQ